MITVKEAIIVEGKYDKIRLSNFIDGLIITTDGFGIFKNKEKQQLILLSEIFLKVQFRPNRSDMHIFLIYSERKNVKISLQKRASSVLKVFRMIFWKRLSLHQAHIVQFQPDL